MGASESRRALWAWAWLICIGLLGWAPALVIAYSAAFALKLGMNLDGSLAFQAIYALLTLTSLFLIMQMRQFFGITGRLGNWFLYGGGGGLIAIWWAAFAAIT